jgi:hypothetical protein
MDQDRRQAERVPYPCEVKCTLDDGLEIASARLSDVSTSGAFVESVNELPIGSVVHLLFQVGDRTLKVRGRIVQSMAQFGFGVKFEQVPSDEGAALAQLVAQRG